LNLERLDQEHRLIERFLQLLKAWEERHYRKLPLPDGWMSHAVDFIKLFTDGIHHAKEEHVLFPFMENHGIPREGGPIGVMLAEHGDARTLATAMESAWKAGDPAAFFLAGKKYGQLLTQHIFKEDHILYPMAKGAIFDDGAVAVEEAFLQVEKPLGGDQARNQWFNWIDLEERQLKNQ